MTTYNVVGQSRKSHFQAAAAAGVDERRLVKTGGI